MNQTIRPSGRKGTAAVPASKSQAHRYLICAGLSEEPSEIVCRGISEDIQATIDCLNAMGAKIETEGDLIRVTPLKEISAGHMELHCKESGSTLRFLLPIVGVLGGQATFYMDGRLPSRTPQVYIYEMIAHGMNILQNGSMMECSGRLLSGMYMFPGNISSQFISGMLMASPLLDSDNIIRITGEIQSRNYLSLTEDALKFSNVGFGKGHSAYMVYGQQKYMFPAEAVVEGDWSAAAFFLCMGALSKEGITVRGLSADSSQGDKKILDLLREFGAEVRETEDGITVREGELKGISVDAADIPDLIPAVAALASAADGTTVITHAERLRLKETDRLKSTCGMLKALGADILEASDGMIVNGKERLNGGTTQSYGDHRIAMAAAVAACRCEQEVVVEDAQCVAKSYPAFWEDFAALEEEG